MKIRRNIQICTDIPSQLIPLQRIGRSGWTRLGEEFRVTICRNEHMQYSDDMVLSDYEALKNGTKTLADLKDYFRYKTKDEYYLGLNDIEPEF